MDEQLTTSKTNIWYTEYHTNSTGITFRVKDILHREDTKYQELVIMDTFDYGKVMLLDGLVMLTDRDEFVYHEMITHVPMHTGRNIKKVLIIGGGDCGTLRELQKYSSIESIIMVEIDGSVVEQSRILFPNVFAEPDKKSKLLIDDGIKFVAETSEKFDLIIIDSTDPIGPAEGLFSEMFYTNCRKILNKDGILALQAESPYIFPKTVENIYKRLSSVFNHVNPYLAYIPTYPSGMWQFLLCSDSDMHEYRQNNASAGFMKSMKYYNPDVHNAAFALPNFVKDIYGL